MKRAFLLVLVVASLITMIFALELRARRESEGNPSKPDDRTAQSTVSDPATPSPKPKAVVKWGIVKAKPADCGWCDWIDQVTWQDGRVLSWLNEHAVVMTVDLATDSDTAKTLSLDANQAVIVAYRDDKEFDRIGAHQSPAELLEWLQGLERGERSIVQCAPPRSRVQDPEAGSTRMRKRWGDARALIDAGKFTLAADEYIWLWRHMLEYDDAMDGVRGSYIVDDMTSLAARSRLARKKLEAVRDETGERLKGPKVLVDDLRDWIDLNRALGDNKATLTWFDSVKDDRRLRPLILAAGPWVEQRLIERKRWADLSRTHRDPFFELENSRQCLQTVREHPVDEHKYVFTKDWLLKTSEGFTADEVGKTYAGLLAAHKEDLAAAFAGKAKEYFGAERVSLAAVSWALRARQVREEHVEWLAGMGEDEAAAELLERVKEARSEQGTGGPGR